MRPARISSSAVGTSVKAADGDMSIETQVDSSKSGLAELLLRRRWLSFLPVVFLDFAIDRDGDEAVSGDVLELDNLMTGAGELSPAAGLVGVLFDGGVLVSVNGEGNGTEALGGGAADGDGVALEGDGIGGHHLGGNGLEGGEVHVLNIVTLPRRQVCLQHTHGDGVTRLTGRCDFRPVCLNHPWEGVTMSRPAEI